MKDLILTAQDARELQALGALTITKAIKRGPVYVEGTTFEQEGAGYWRIKDAEGNNLPTTDPNSASHLAPVKAGEPVMIREPWKETGLDMPAGYIFAADLSEEEAKKAGGWASPVCMPKDAARRWARVVNVSATYGPEVTPSWIIELVLIDRAIAEAIDAGLPVSTAEPGEGSDYAVYAGDMSSENHDRMMEAIAHGRELLAEIQDEIIKTTVDLAAIPGGAEHITEAATLSAHLDDLKAKEGNLKTSLTDAGAPCPTTTERAVERIKVVQQKAAAARRRLSAEGENVEPRDDDNAAAEEFGKMVSEYDVLRRYLAIEGVGLPPEEPVDSAGEPVELNLEDLAEAAKNAPITTGVCKHCGQMIELGGGYATQAAADAAAEELCDCAQARTARRMAAQIKDARARVRQLFGEEAEKLGFIPLADDDAVELLERVAELIAIGPISSATLNVRGRCKAKLSISSKGKIKVSRSETKSCDLEAGE